MRLPPSKSHTALRSVRIPLATLALVAGLAGTASAAPPPNDFFTNAIVINPAALPFNDSQLMSEASTEGGEPSVCSFTFQTMWYRITPASDMWVTATGSGLFSTPAVSVFRDTGGGIFGLAFLNCSFFGGQGVNLLRAGTRYYFQVSAPCCGVQGTFGISVNQVPAPVPVANFFFNPDQPSVFDQVTFFDNSFDPGQQGIRSRHYDYGDGSGSTDADSTTCCPAHRYTADGDYTVRLTVTTTDGRSASVTRVIHVRTHDVTITDFKVPQSGNVGQTKPITVSVSNTRYPETVHVQLYKAVPGNFFPGYEPIGSLQQLVLVRGGNRATDFSFSYTFTPDDGALGKVSLRAEADLEYPSRDAIEADNEALSGPIRVGKGGGRLSGTGLEVNAGAGEASFGPLGVTPNPARAGADLAVRLALPEAGEASVQVLDVAGRVMASRELGRMDAGVHEVRVAWQERPAPGIYWVRLAQPGRAARTLRVAVLD